ncbi:hypothetical protein FQZ97_863970 [compost metagenome]
MNLNVDAGSIEDLLQPTEVFRMRSAGTQATEPSHGQRRVNGDETILADVERHALTLMVTIKGRRNGQSKCQENDGSCPLGRLLRPRRLGNVVEADPGQPKTLSERVLLLTITPDDLADGIWPHPLSDQVYGTDQAIHPPRKQSDRIFSGMQCLQLSRWRIPT